MSVSNHITPRNNPEDKNSGLNDFVDAWMFQARGARCWDFIPVL
jgi:hypothetical protein